MTRRNHNFAGDTVKAAIYARVSTTDQTCESQLSELHEYAMRRGWRVVREYLDTGWSGAKVSRPQLDQLMRDAALHQFDAVLCWKLDRFGRSVTHTDFREPAGGRRRGGSACGNHPGRSRSFSVSPVPGLVEQRVLPAMERFP
jgi:hypothetical protein